MKIMRKTKSLKNEILRVLSLFSILVILIIGSLSIINMYNSNIELISYNQNLVLKQANKEVNNLIVKIEDLSKYLYKNYELDKNIIKHIVKTDNNISSILILNDKGFIKDVYSLSNKNVYKGFDYSNKVYYKKLKNNENYWSNIFLSKINEEPTISFSFRMKSDIGVFLINLSSLSSFINQFKNSDDSYILRVFDKNGIIIINPDSKQLVLERFNASNFEIYTELINKEKEFSQTVFYSSKTKNKEFGAYTKSNKSNWTIVVRESYTKILDSMKTVILSMLLTMVLFILLSISLSIQISKKIFNSLDDMQNITSNIADGNYSYKVRNLYYDEFNSLLDSFNKMQIQIDKREYHLEASIKSFKTLINSTMEAIIIHEDGVCTDVNDVCLKLFKQNDKKEFLGKPLLDIVAPSFKDLVMRNCDKNTEPYEVELLRNDASKIEALVQGKFLYFQEKELRIFTIIDISELKNKERLLFQQTKMASLGEMLENIAHQWRQPLCSITASASSVRIKKELSTLTDKNFEESLNSINDNAIYLSNTIDDFRNFFKPEKEVINFALSDTVKNALNLVSSKLLAANIELKKIFLNDDCIYKGFRNEFIQVIINLLNNAIDALLLNNSEDNRYIEIEELLYKDKYQLKIKDNAGGINDSLLEKIYEPYFTTKHKSQGTGIGLYMSLQIINDHMKGDLRVENIDIIVNNDSYRGCCFIIELPIL